MKKLFILLIISAAALGAVYQVEWKIDPGTTVIGFSIKNFGKKVHGTFSGLAGSIIFDPQQPEQGSFDVKVDVSSISTGIKKRDDHLRSADYFDAAKFPVMRFKSKKIAKTESGYIVTGDLTIKDKTQQVDIPFTYEPNDKGGILKGSFTLDRVSYGVGEKSRIMGETATVDLQVGLVKE